VEVEERWQFRGQIKVTTLFKNEAGLELGLTKDGVK